MAFVHGSQTRLLVNEKEISSEVSGWNMSFSRAMSEVTTIGQTPGAAGAKFTPGLMAGTLSVRGPQVSDPTDGLTEEIWDAIGVDNVFLATVLTDQDSVGKPAMFILGDLMEYAVDATVSDAVSMTFSAQADESVEMGYVLQPLTALTADQLTGTAVDRGASPLTPTTAGLVAAIHVTAFTGFSSVAVKIQHSTDNSSWADLVSFTNVTAVGYERVSVANGTSIRRYLRAAIDVTGTGSVTLLVAAAPR